MVPTPAEVKSKAVESKVPGEILAKEPKGSAQETRKMGVVVEIPPPGFAMGSIPKKTLLKNIVFSPGIKTSILSIFLFGAVGKSGV